MRCTDCPWCFSRTRRSIQPLPCGGRSAMAREFGDRCATRVSTGAAQDALNPSPPACAVAGACRPCYYEQKAWRRGRRRRGRVVLGQALVSNLVHLCKAGLAIILIVQYLTSYPCICRVMPCDNQTQMPLHGAMYSTHASVWRAL